MGFFTSSKKKVGEAPVPQQLAPWRGEGTKQKQKQKHFYFLHFPPLTNANQPRTHKHADTPPWVGLLDPVATCVD
jgi:hypothetical protein